jgi:hypothetical protein
MIRLGMSSTTSLVSFPEDIATDLKGEFSPKRLFLASLVQASRGLFLKRRN